MKVSNRQRRILKVLLNRHGDITAGELALDVQISARTVHRELQELEPLLADYGLSLVKKSGIGISLEGDERPLALFQKELRHSETETYSPIERKVLMLCLLLEEEEPVKLFSLAREVQAAIPTVSRDLDELEPQLVRSGLALVRKRGYGVEITGPESAKRQFIVWMAEEYLDYSDWFGTPRNPSEQWPVTRRLLDLVGKDTFLQIEQSLWQQAEEWLNELKDSDYTRLLIRLSVAVTRIRRKYKVQHGTDNLPSAAAQISDNAKLKLFTDSLGLELQGEEVAYMHKLFEEAKEKAADISSVILNKYGLDLAEQTIALIRSVEDRHDVKLSKDRSLLDGLIRHLGPALERIGRNESIRNPLLSQIKKDYDALFTNIRESANKIWSKIDIPDEEIGYLTMHFGAALERWRLMPAGLKALLVCTSGIGSSKLLAVRISKEIPQIDLIGLYSWYEASRIPEDQYDLIISTIDLPVEPDRYIKLSPLLTREETEQLRTLIRGMTVKKRAALPTVPIQDQGAWERMKRMAKYAPAITGLLAPFRVYEIDNEPDDGNLQSLQSLQSLLTKMLDQLSPQFAKDHEALIIKALMDRESQGSLLIPDSELALFHTRSEWIPEPVLALFRLKVPYSLDGDSGSQARQILLMLAPRMLNKESLEVLSEISAMLLLAEQVRLLEEADEDKIRAFISRNLEDYIKSKLEWRDAT